MRTSLPNYRRINTQRAHHSGETLVRRGEVRAIAKRMGSTHVRLQLAFESIDLFHGQAGIALAAAVAQALQDLTEAGIRFVAFEFTLTLVIAFLIFVVALLVTDVALLLPRSSLLRCLGAWCFL
jgi:hypothetical protein